MKITINCNEYKVIENLSYHGCGYPTKIVETESGEKIAIQFGGLWRFWTPADRLGATPQRKETE